MKAYKILRHPAGWIALLCLVSLYAIYLSLQVFDTKGVAAYLQAQNIMLLKAADGSASCLNKSDLVAWAEEQNWNIEPYVDTWSSAPAPPGGALRVDVKPPLPFAKEPGMILRFDADDCLLSGLR